MIGSLLRKAAGIFRRPLSLRDPGGWPAAHEPYSGEPISANGVLGLSAVWACVNLIAGTISSLPLMVYRTSGKGARTIAFDHPLFPILHDSPNYDQTAVDFLEFLTASIELWGNGYARVFREGGKVVALEPVRPDFVAVQRDRPSGNIHYRWSDDGQAYDFTQNSMLHVRGFGGNPLGGMSTLSFGRHAFGLATAIDRSAGATFRNGLRPAGTLTFQQFLTDEQRSIVETKLGEKFSGAVNSGRPLVLEGGTKWESLSISPDDAQMLESRGFSVEEVCRFFGVPPHMVGHTTKTTSWGTGLEQQTLGFQKFTLRRRLKRLETALEKQLLTAEDRANGIIIEFSLEGLLRGDSEARSKFYTAGLASGWLTVNEVRSLENLPPVDGGDVPRTQMQNVPLTEAGKPPPAVIPAPGGQ